MGDSLLESSSCVKGAGAAWGAAAIVFHKFRENPFLICLSRSASIMSCGRESCMLIRCSVEEKCSPVLLFS